MKNIIPIAVIVMIGIVAMLFFAERIEPAQIIDTPVEEIVAVPEEIPDVDVAEPSGPPTGLVAQVSIDYKLREISPLKNYSSQITAQIYNGYRWGAMPIKYNITNDGFVAPTTYYEAVRDAVAFWEDLSEGKIQFEEVGSAEEAQLDFIFDSDYRREHGRLGEAVTLLGYSGAVPYAVESEVRVSAPTTKCSAYWRAAHEVGHALGFSHTTDKTSVMFGFGETCIGTAGQDVEDGMQQMYLDFPDEADLRINSVQGLRVGSAFHLWYDFANVGVKDTGPFSAGIYSNGNEVIDMDIDSILPGERARGRLELEIPDGTYVTLEFIADDENEITEIDEDDNSVELFAEV